MIFVLSPEVSQALTPLRLTGWDGAVELGGQWESQDSETSTLRRFRGEERLRLGIEGFSVDPKWMRFVLRGGFGFAQEDLTQNDQSFDSNGRLLDYDLQAHLLEQKPIRLMAFGNRIQEIISREFAPRTEVRNENHGVTIRFGGLLIPSNFTYRHEETFQESSFGGSITQWNRIGENFFYQGGRHWERTDLDLQYRYEDVEDLIRPTFSYRTQQGALFHRFLFGPDYEHDLTTTARYFYRDGPSPFASANLYASEQATLRPTDSFTSSVGFIVNREEVKQRDVGLDEVTTAYTGFVNLTHQLYESLTSRLISDVVVTDFPVGTEKRYEVRPSLNYRKRIPGEGLLLLGLDGRYELVDRNAITRTVIEERVVTGIPFRIVIPIPIGAAVDLSTLTVINLDKGLTLSEGPDYTVIATGPDQVILDVITTDTNRVSTGNNLQVRFTFHLGAVTPMRFETLGVRTLIGFDFNWTAVSYQHEQQNQNLISGQDGTLLDDITWDTVNLQFRFQPGRTNFLLFNEYRRYDSTPLAYREWQFNQIMTYIFTGQLTASLQAVESLTDYKVPVRETDRYDARLHLNWRPGYGMEISPFAAYRRYEDTIAPDETVRTIGLRGRLAWAKLEFLSFFQYDAHHRNGSDITDYQVDVRLVRRF